MLLCLQGPFDEPACQQKERPLSVGADCERVSRRYSTAILRKVFGEGDPARRRRNSGTLHRRLFVLYAPPDFCRSRRTDKFAGDLRARDSPYVYTHHARPVRQFRDVWRGARGRRAKHPVHPVSISSLHATARSRSLCYLDSPPYEPFRSDGIGSSSRFLILTRFLTRTGVHFAENALAFDSI